MFGPVTAIAVDDEPSHLLAITAGLSASGIACMGFWYDRDTHQLNPRPPADGLPYLRLVFMDLNLEALGGGNPDPANLAGAVMGVLKQIVAPSAGPYLLIFWTQVTGKTHAVRDLLYERLEGIPLPLDVLAIPKGNFIVTPTAGSDFNAALKELYLGLQSNMDALRAAVVDAVTHNSQISLLAYWEARAAEAAARTVNEVHACAVNDVPPKTPASNSLQRVLAEIARAASGARPAIKLPARALDAGMVDILIDQFGASVDNTRYQAIARKAIEQTLKDADKPPTRPGIEFKNPARVAADLNTFFHVDKEVSTAETWDRGVVLPVKEPLNKGVLGFDPDKFLTGEFLHSYQTYPDEQQEAVKAQIEEFRSNAEFVLTELGADCDHSQSTHRTRRYLLGLEVPEKYLRLTQSPKDEQLRNGSLQLLGPWVIGNEIRYLLVSCRRFWTWQGSTPPKSSGIKYRLRGSVVNKLLHHYSVWHSRPGIVEFPV